ncbi:MAG: CxxC-x17-CxxC domain-containing protein [Candidatus Shapirobacteria bacterium]
MGYFNKNDGGRREGGERRMYSAVCSKCGKDCRVPFMPSGDKPIYCSDCFERVGQSGGGFDRPRREFGNKPYGNPQAQNQNNDLLVSINAKLGKILELMMAGEKPAEIEVKPTKKKKV